MYFPHTHPLTCLRRAFDTNNKLKKGDRPTAMFNAGRPRHVDIFSVCIPTKDDDEIF